MRYLLDANVLRALHSHPNVKAWTAGVADDALFVSAFTLYEMRRGWEAERRRGNVTGALAGLATLDALASAYAGRIVAIDAPVAAEWARLVGARDKHRDDLALAATARIHGFVLVTRNVKDVQGRDVRVLDPFVRTPTITLV